jgi:hypothetical protein
MERWMVSLKWLGRKWPWPKEGNIAGYFLKIWELYKKNMFDNPAGFRSRYLPNINLRLAPCNQLFTLSRTSYQLNLTPLHPLKEYFLITLLSGFFCYQLVEYTGVQNVDSWHISSPFCFLTIRININKNTTIYSIIFNYMFQPQTPSSGWTQYIYIYIHRMSQEECARLREGVLYVKVYRYNPKHLYPKLNGYGDNGQGKMWSSCGSTYCTC